MMQYLVWHEGTGTVIDLTECTIVQYNPDKASDLTVMAVIDNDIDEAIHLGHAEGSVDSIEGADAATFIPWEF